MISREEILLYVSKKYHAEPEYPWIRTPNTAILRQQASRKWFAAILDVTADKLGLDGERPVDVLNLKCDPLMIGSLRDGVSIFPAYHMNKEHWISILLDSPILPDKVYGLIDLSYELTK